MGPKDPISFTKRLVCRIQFYIGTEGPSKTFLADGSCYWFYNPRYSVWLVQCKSLTEEKFRAIGL